MDKSNIILRKPRKSDGKKIHGLVKSTKVLDVNSEYLYLLQSTHFQDLCSVATYEDKVIGFVSGYMIPNEPNTLFIWQVAVDDNFRGNDLARRLIMEIINREELNINYLHTTVSPSNNASIRVFEKVAQHFQTNMQSAQFFVANDFANEHEEEVLYKIGPFK
ncbi:diaminobutyrate acetyltransferase [Arcobacter sp. YIC-464]|uniref:diaminobutyrate acetyltransferase n=1 Tax=Arcobacter sp. YIC-464 TaxID=3376631 RepID=UPI003C1367F9